MREDPLILEAGHAPDAQPAPRVCKFLVTIESATGIGHTAFDVRSALRQVYPTTIATLSVEPVWEETPK